MLNKDSQGGLDSFHQRKSCLSHCIVPPAELLSGLCTNLMKLFVIWQVCSSQMLQCSFFFTLPESQSPMSNIFVIYAIKVSKADRDTERDRIVDGKTKTTTKPWPQMSSMIEKMGWWDIKCQIIFFLIHLT